MGYTKMIQIESQNIFEANANKLLDDIERQIDTLIQLYNEKNLLIHSDALFISIERLYELYTIIQISFWDR